jgi:hypothetical protein
MTRQSVVRLVLLALAAFVNAVVWLDGWPWVIGVLAIGAVVVYDAPWWHHSRDGGTSRTPQVPS